MKKCLEKYFTKKVKDNTLLLIKIRYCLSRDEIKWLGLILLALLFIGWFLGEFFLDCYFKEFLFNLFKKDFRYNFLFNKDFLFKLFNKDFLVNDFFPFYFSSLIWGIEHMLSLILSGSNLEKIFSALLFLCTWLIGGGGFISVVVNAIRDFDIELSNGEIRIKPNKFNKHILFLGWEKDNVGIIKQLLDDGHFGPILILSNATVGEIKYQLRDVMNTHSNVAFVFYRGDIESVDERKCLNINQADYVFVTGEEFGNSHDEYALLISQAIDNNSKMIEIDSFDLYCQYLKRDDAKLYFNFYHEWAKKILHTHNLHRNKETSHLIIVGFSEMGMALLLEAVSIVKKGYKTYITVYDDSQGRNEIRFRSLFPDIDIIEEINLTFISDVEIGSDAFINSIKDSADGSHDLTLAVTCRDSSQSMAVMLPITDAVKDDENAVILLEQDISKCGLKERILPHNVFVFGSESGTGICKDVVLLPEEVGEALGIKSKIIDAKKFRNQHTESLKKYAKKLQNKMEFLCALRGIIVRTVLGGSLYYDAALKGDYDIDLRALVLDSWLSPCEQRRIDTVRDILINEFKGDPSFSVSLKTENGTKYIWHTKRKVKNVPGLPEDIYVELSWNIQAESTYRGIAKVARELPQEINDRYVIAKWMAREKSESVYSETKKQWVDFIDWIIDEGGQEIKREEVKKLLESNPDKIPSFLK